MRKRRNGRGREGHERRRRPPVRRLLVRPRAHRPRPRSRRGRPGAPGRRRPMRRTLLNAVRRKPQVMVKITSFARSKEGLAAHLDYISRNGQNEVFDPAGEPSAPSAHRWASPPAMPSSTTGASWRPGRSRRHALGKKKTGRPRSRVSMNLMLSMPAGTDTGAFELAVRDFLNDQFQAHDRRLHLPRRPRPLPRPCRHRAPGPRRPLAEPAQERPAGLARDLRRQPGAPRHRRRGHPRLQPRQGQGRLPPGPGGAEPPRHPRAPEPVPELRGRDRGARHPPPRRGLDPHRRPLRRGRRPARPRTPSATTWRTTTTIGQRPAPPESRRRRRPRRRPTRRRKRPRDQGRER